MGTAVFRERLIPGWQVFGFALGCLGLVAIAYGAVLGTAVGVGLFILAGMLVAIVMIAASPVIIADPGGLRVGAATLPRACIGAVEILDPQAMADLRAQGPRAISTAFTVLRPSRSRSAVRITVADPQDPHPFWLITSRRPAQLAAALQ